MKCSRIEYKRPRVCPATAPCPLVWTHLRVACYSSSQILFDVEYNSLYKALDVNIDNYTNIIHNTDLHCAISQRFKKSLLLLATFLLEPDTQLKPALTTLFALATLTTPFPLTDVIAVIAEIAEE